MAASSAWIPRGAQAPLAQALQDSPVVCLVGPRQCGKSSLAQRHNSARPYFTFDDSTLLSAAVADPAGFVAGLPPVVTLDEIQRVPGVLPAIKMSVDRDRRSGRFLLTGSADLLLLPAVSESLAGRMEVVRLYPLTEAEKERKPGRLLERLLEGSLKPATRPGEPPVLDVVERLLRGGYPAILHRTPDRVRQWHRAYADALINRDAKDVTSGKGRSSSSPWA